MPSIAEAVDRFLADAVAQNLGPESIRKYRNVLRPRLLAWCADKGFKDLRQLGVEQLRELRRSWPDGPGYATKNLERLRTFFRSCLEAGWRLGASFVPVRISLEIRGQSLLAVGTQPSCLD